MAKRRRRWCGRPPRSELKQAAGVAVQQFLCVFGAERQRLQPFGAGRVFGERVIDREQDAVDAHFHHAAPERVSEKPLVVIQKCSQKMSRKVSSFIVARSPWQMRHSRNGNPSPMCPRMILRPGWASNTPLKTKRRPWVAVSTVKPQAARRIPGCDCV